MLIVALAVSLVGILSLWLKQEAQGCSQPHHPMACLTPSFPLMRCCGGSTCSLHREEDRGLIYIWEGIVESRRHLPYECSHHRFFLILNLHSGTKAFIHHLLSLPHWRPPVKGSEGRKGLEMPTLIFGLRASDSEPQKGHRKRKKHFLSILQAVVTSNNKVDECQLPIVLCPFQLCEAWHSGWHCTNSQFYKFCPLHLVRLKKEKFIHSICHYIE